MQMIILYISMLKVSMPKKRVVLLRNKLRKDYIKWGIFSAEQWAFYCNKIKRNLCWSDKSIRFELRTQRGPKHVKISRNINQNRNIYYAIPLRGTSSRTSYERLVNLKFHIDIESVSRLWPPFRRCLKRTYSRFFIQATRFFRKNFVCKCV